MKIQILDKTTVKASKQNASKLFPSRNSGNSKPRTFYEYLYFCSKNNLTEKSKAALVKGFQAAEFSILKTVILLKTR